MSGRKTSKIPLAPVETDLKTLIRRIPNPNIPPPLPSPSHLSIPQTTPPLPHTPSTPWTAMENLHLIVNRLCGYTWASIAHYLQAQLYTKTDLDCLHQARLLHDSGEWLEYLYEWAADDYFPPPPRHMFDGEDELKHRWYCKILGDVRRVVGPPRAEKADRSAEELGMPDVRGWSEGERRGVEVLFEFGDLRWPRGEECPVVGRKKVIR